MAKGSRLAGVANGLVPRRRAGMPDVITCTSEGDDPSGRGRQGVNRPDDAPAGPAHGCELGATTRETHALAVAGNPCASRMIPLESPVPAIGTPGSESGGRKRAYGLRTAARPRKRRTSHRALPVTRLPSTLHESGRYPEDAVVAGRVSAVDALAVQAADARAEAHADHHEGGEVRVSAPSAVRARPRPDEGHAIDPEEAVIGRPTPTARRLVEASVSPNTRRAYAGALRRLDAWLAGRELDDVALAAYLAELHDAGRASSSASMAIAAACFRAKLAGQPTPASERTARVLAGYRRTAGDRGRGQARP